LIFYLPTDGNRKPISVFLWDIPFLFDDINTAEELEQWIVLMLGL